MQPASAWLEEYRDMWIQNFDNLGQYFADQDASKQRDKS